MENTIDMKQQMLREYANSGSMFFKLGDGEEARVKLLDYEMVPCKINNGKTTQVRYHLEVNGERVFFDKSSKKLAKQMSEVPRGSVINIRRKGKNNQSEYFIDIIE